MNLKRTFWLTLLMLIILLLLGNNLLMITDPVESNYTLTAKEMLEVNDWISPRIHGHYWYDKPIFFYWELMAAFSLLGTNEFAARLFPVIFCAANIILTYWFAKRLYGIKIGIMAMMIFGTSIECWYIGKAVITDMTMTFFFNAVLIAFYIGFKEGRRNLYLLCYAFAGLAVLTKGPIGLLLPGLIVVVFLFSRHHASELLRMKWLPGLAVFTAVGCSWYWKMYKMHGQEFIDGFFGVHNFLRATVSEHPRDDVFYYYIIIFLLGFLPWSVVLLHRLKKDWRQLRSEPMADHTVFLLQWVIIVNVFFQLMATKYVTYTLPAFMPLAILTARVLQERYDFVRKLSLGTGLVLALLTYTVAVPVCQLRSGHNVADFIMKINTGLPVYSFGSYKTSEKYYYGQEIPCLVSAEEKEKVQPNGISWNATNVMNFQTIEDLPHGADIIISCSQQHKTQLQDELPKAKIKTLAQIGKRYVLKVSLPQ